MTRPSESRKRLCEHCQEMLEEFGKENYVDNDIRIRLATLEKGKDENRIPSWALGVGHILNSMGSLLSHHIIESFGLQVDNLFENIQGSFSKEKNELEGTEATKVVIGPQSQSSPSPEVLEELRELAQALTTATQQVLDQGGMPKIFIYDAPNGCLVPADNRFDYHEDRSIAPDPAGVETLDKILSNKDLPVVPNAVLELRKLAFDSDFQWEHIISIVNRDAVLTGHILRFANSPIRRRHEELTNISAACKMIGARHVAGIAFGLALRKQAKVKAESFNADDYWAASSARAAAAWRIAHSVEGINPQDAYTAGLLCKIGSLAIATVFHEEYDMTHITPIKDAEQKLGKLQRSVFGVDHAGISAAISEQWNMPTWFCQAIEYHLKPNNVSSGEQTRLLASILAAACQVASIFMGAETEQLQGNVASVIRHGKYIGFCQNAFEPIFNDSIEEWQATCCVYEAPHKAVLPWCDILAEVS
jgi:HD-like signal output (HDOD) protein